MRKRYDVIIIGAGVLGASAAYHCSKAGLRVLVLERAEPLSGASGATFAWCGAHLKTPVSYNLLSQQAIALYAGLEAALEAELEYARVGSITLLPEADYVYWQERIQGMQEEGYSLKLLERGELARLEPEIPAHYTGGLHCPLDVEINPFLLVPAYLRQARRLGAELRYGQKVLHLGADARGCQVLTRHDRYRSTQVVLAGGIHSPALGALLNTEVPLRCSRGQILVTERTRHLLHSFVNLRRAPEQGGFMLRQVRSGNVLVGYTEEACDPEAQEPSRDVTVEGMRMIAGNVLAGFPAMGELQIIRSYAGIRPIPADGLPIISEIPQQPGVILTVTHSGYTLSVLVGRVVAERILGRDHDALFAQYGLQRFATAKGQASALDGSSSAFGGSS